MSEKAEERAKEAHAFWLEVARTLDVWQRAEQELCEIFVTIVQSTVGDVVRAAFYKVISVRTKIDMITAALSIRVEDEVLNAKWKTLSERTNKQVKKRNQLAHGTRWTNNDVSVMGPHLSDIVLRDRHIRTNEDQYLDAKKIHAMQKTFWDLALALSDFRQDVGNHVMSLGKPIHLPQGRT